MNSLTEKLAWVLDNDGKHDLAQEMREAVMDDGKEASNMIDCSFQEDLNPEFKYHYKLESSLPAIPPGALEMVPIFFLLRSPSSFVETILKLRLHTQERFYDYPVRIIKRRGAKI